MLSLVLPACGSAVLVAGTGLAAWRQHRSVVRERSGPGDRVTSPGMNEPDLPQRSSGLEQRRSLAELLDLLPHSVVALGPDGELLHANRAAHAQFGDTLASLLRHKMLGDAIRRLAYETTVEVEMAIDVPVRRVLRATLQADRPQTGIQLILLALSDRTEQVALDRMRSDFIANASHELRTPLASLIGFIETLQGPAADDAPARIRFLAIMAGQAARMRRLIDNLLSLSRIQMHEHERPSGRVAPGELLLRIADEHEPQLVAAGVVLTIEIDDDLPQLVADADQLAQVLQNLLDNALKYAGRPGRQGQVMLAAHAARVGLDPSSNGPSLNGVVLVVEDDGLGIAPHHVPRLTERFYRVENAGPPKSGSGLGLAIVKHIVGRHGGRLTIEGRPGQGARFSVWLPAAPRPER
jgi:two-component system phosphate regulon sensor histidine kinase PhoR